MAVRQTKDDGKMLCQEAESMSATPDPAL